MRTRFIKDADHLAAAIERRVFFSDFTCDCEAPGMDDLAAEVFADHAADVLPAARGDGFEASHMENIIDVGSDDACAMWAMLSHEMAWLDFMIYSRSGLIGLVVTAADKIKRMVVE